MSAFAEGQPNTELDLAFEQKVEFSGSVYSGQWSSDEFVSFLTVKAGNEFMLYQLSQPATSGAWSTAGLVNNHGIAHAVSHISLWSSPFIAPAPPPIAPPPPDRGSLSDVGNNLVIGVPEPATWMTLILGFGGIGATLRRRRARLSV